MKGTGRRWDLHWGGESGGCTAVELAVKLVRSSFHTVSVCLRVDRYGAQNGLHTLFLFCLRHNRGMMPTLIVDDSGSRLAFKHQTTKLFLVTNQEAD